MKERKKEKNLDGKWSQPGACSLVEVQTNSEGLRTLMRGMGRWRGEGFIVEEGRPSFFKDNSLVSNATHYSSAQILGIFRTIFRPSSIVSLINKYIYIYNTKAVEERE